MTDMDKKILDAFEIAVKTHENISKLIKCCKKLCTEFGYDVLTKDFIHWWTFNDNDDPVLPGSASWSTRWFILLFKRKGDEENAIYMMEVNLTIPSVTVAKFIYNNDVDYSEMIKNYKFDYYSLPVNMYYDKYSYKKVQEFTKATFKTDVKYNKSWANRVWFAEFPLSEITSENVREKIFGTFDKLAAMND